MNLSVLECYYRNVSHALNFDIYVFITDKAAIKRKIHIFMLAWKPLKKYD